MQDQHKFILISMVSGLLSGLVVALTLSSVAEQPRVTDSSGSVSRMADNVAAVSVESPKAFTPPRQPTPLSTRRADVHLRQQQGQVQHLEQRVQQLGGMLNALQGAAQDFKVEALTDANISPEEAKATNLHWWEETKRRFEQEEVDPGWAKATKGLFEFDMAELVEVSGFSIVHTECRSTQCAAVLEWPSYDEATLGYAALLHHPYRANCARHTLLPAPSEEEADQPYHMTLIFDCNEWRETGAQEGRTSQKSPG